MGMVETRSAERRRQILAAARDAFAARGFHAASMSEIAAGAGVSVGHIYRYFENKEAVVGAIVGQDLEDAAVSIASLAGDPQAVAAQIVADVERRATPAKLSLMLEVLSEAARNPQVAALVRAADDQIRGHLRAALGACAREPVAACALDCRVEVVCALIEGLLVRTVKTADGDRREVTARVQALLAATIAA